MLRRLKRLYWNLRATNLRGLCLHLRHKRLALPLLVRGHCRFVNLRHMRAGRHLVIADNVEIFINPPRGQQAQLIAGNNVSIGRHTIIGCANCVVIEDDVTLAPHVHITDRNHSYEDIGTPICRQPAVSPGPVVIGSGTWVGFGAQIMPGVTIGPHCVIAAGSIVTRDIPGYCVAAGVPARVIKRYDPESGKWVAI